MMLLRWLVRGEGRETKKEKQVGFGGRSSAWQELMRWLQRPGVLRLHFFASRDEIVLCSDSRVDGAWL